MAPRCAARAGGGRARRTRPAFEPRRLGRGPPRTSSSLTSRTLDATVRARSCHSASSANRWPYSFIIAPHPAAFTPMCRVRAFERRDVRLREAARRVRVAGVRVQRAAAALSRRARDGVVVRQQHAFGRAIRLGEQSLHDAAGEQRDRPARPIRVRRRSRRVRSPASRAQHRHREAESPGRPERSLATPVARAKHGRRPARVAAARAARIRRQ